MTKLELSQAFERLVMNSLKGIGSKEDSVNEVFNALNDYEKTVHNEAIEKASQCTRDKNTQLAILKLKK